MKKKPNTSGGQAVILTVIFFLIISVAVIAAVVVPTSNQVKSVRELARAKAGYIAADSVNSDAYYRIALGKTLPSTLTLPFSNGISASSTVTTAGGVTQVRAAGLSGTTLRYAQTNFVQSAAFGLPYALSVGTGGISLGGGSYVTGDVYTNGNIVSDSSGSYISGSATAANTTPPVIDQSVGYTDGTTPLSITVGSSASNEDIAESFQVTSSVGLTYIRLYAKKVGYIGSDSTVRIVTDNGGKPSKTVVASGTMKADTITTSFTYTTVSISGLPSLTPGTTYWLVVDKPSNQSFAYYVFAGTAGTYASGSAKVGQWTSSNGGTWANLSPSNTDLYFDIFLGGNPSRISGADQYSRLSIGSGGSGSAWAYQIDSASVKSTSYCYLGNYIFDQNGNSTNCNTTRGAPTTIDLAITPAQITAWQNTAATVVQNGSVSIGSASTTGPKKIVGNLSISSGATVDLSGPVWVTGNVTINGGAILRVPPSAGTNGGILIADGTITVSGGGELQGSGVSGSYMMIISNSTSASAISISGGAGSIILVALNGTVTVSGGGSANDVVAKQFNMTGGSHVIYDSSLQGLGFVGVSGGAWKVDSWAEVAE